MINYSDIVLKQNTIKPVHVHPEVFVEILKSAGTYFILLNEQIQDVSMAQVPSKCICCCVISFHNTSNLVDFHLQVKKCGCEVN